MSKCLYCDKKATRWCDFLYGFDATDCPDGLMASLETPLVHCDAGLCEEHAVFKGNIFIDGSPSVTCVESIDWCCGHKDEEVLRPLTKGQIEIIKYKHMCEAKGGLRLVRVTQPDLFVGIKR